MLPVLVGLKRFSGNPIFASLLQRVLAVSGGVITIAFIAAFLSADQQGVYYTFNSLIALQMFIELGLNYAIILFVSHEVARIRILINGRISGDPAAKRRLQSLVRFSFVWNLAGACVLSILLIPLGLIFLKYSLPDITYVSVSGAWILLVLAAVLLLVVNACLAILEGFNKVAEVAYIRIAQLLVSLIFLWSLLAHDKGLYALALSHLSAGFVGTTLIIVLYRNFIFNLLFERLAGKGFSWRNELWPFQYRIALSWISGYFVSQIFVPILVFFGHTAEAGKMGMSLHLVFTLNNTSIIWLNAKSPLFGQLVALKNQITLNSKFRRYFALSVIFFLVSVLLVISGLYLSRYIGWDIQVRLVSPFGLGCLIISAFANHIVFAEAIYLRAHKIDPFMPVSLVNAVVTALLTAVLISTYGLNGALASFMFSSIVLNFVVCTVIFLDHYYTWQRRNNWST